MIFPGRPEPTTPRQRGLTPDGTDAAAPVTTWLAGMITRCVPLARWTERWTASPA